MTLPELAVGEPASLNETVETIAKSALELFSADVCLMVAVNPITEWSIEPPFLATNAQDNEMPASYHLRLDEIVSKTLDQRLVVLDRSTEQAGEELDRIGFAGVSSLAAVSLRTRRQRKPLAVLFIGYRESREFDPHLWEDLKAFADHAALTLKDTWLLRRYREVARIGQEINQNLETPETLFKKLSAEVADIIDTSYFFALMVDQPHTDSVAFYVSERGKYKSWEGDRDHPTFHEDQSKLIQRYSEEAGISVQKLNQIKGTEETVPESLVFVPLAVGNARLGFLSVQHVRPDTYDNEDLQLLELIGNQVSQALANLRLFEYLRELNVTGQQLTQQLDSDRLFQEVVDRIRETTEADLVALYPYDEKRAIGSRFELPPLTSGDLFDKNFPKPQVKPDDMAWLALEKGEPIFEKDAANLYERLGGDPAKRKGFFEEREQVKSTAVLTLKIGEEAVGVLFISYRIEQRFDAPQRTLLLSLANYAAIAIRNSRLLDQRHVLERLREIDGAISRTLDLNQVLQTILKEATKVVQADEAAILLYDVRKNALETKAAIGVKTEERLRQGIPLVRGKGITWWAFKKKIVVRAGNVHSEKWKGIYQSFSEDTISEIDVPLLDGDEAIGVINFESARENAHSQADEEFVTNLAIQAVLAVRNAQVYEQEQQTSKVLLAMHEIEREIVGHLNLKELLEKILGKALDVTRSAAGQVLLYDSRRNDLHIAVERGVLPEFKEGRQAEGEGIVWEAIKQRKPLNVDITDPLWADKYVRFIPNVRWELAVPILDGEKAKGVINIESRAENPFTEKDENLLARLADLALIAIQNAEQYEVVEEGKRQLEALRKVDLEIISQQDDPDLVIRKILESAGWLTTAEIAGLHFYEEGLPGRTYVSKQKTEGRQTQWEALSRDEIVVASPEQSPGIVEHVAQTGEPYLTQGDAQDDRYYQGGPEIHSELAVPMKLEGKVIGVLNLESPRFVAFDQEDLKVLELLAGQAVIAIQNATNFSKAREESKRFRLLLDVGRQLGAINDPEQKATAIDIVIGEVMAHSFGEVIYRRYEESTQEFVRERYERLVSTTPPLRVKKGAGLNGMVEQKREAILIPDVDRLEKGSVRPQADPIIKTLIGAPVIFGKRYYGNIILRHQKAGFYQESDLKLVEGLATQLAITLRRLEVVEEQRETEEHARAIEMITELGQSAYEITHRLGNDLGLITTYVNRIRDNLAKMGIANNVLNEALEKIVEDVGRVLSMSRGFKDKIAQSQEGGKLTVSQVIAPINGHLKEARSGLPIIPPNIELFWDEADNLGDVRISASQFADILYTLVTNAIEAMTEGGTITVRATKAESNVCIEVTDNGPGIPSSDQSKVFKLFFSTKNSSGFGLWSARRYARANGGDLTMSSRFGEGATFTLRLPVERSGSENS